MKEWSVRIVMTANERRLLKFLFVALLAGGPQNVFAQASAPPLLNVKEIQVQHPRLGNNEASNACGVIQSQVTADILKKLKEDQLPAFSVIEAPAPKMDLARIDLFPEIVTLQRQGLDCTSWISLTAQSKATVRVPPVETPRHVTINYWRGGLMVSSTQIGHARTVREALIKLAAQFSRQYRSDQPPPMPDLGE